MLSIRSICVCGAGTMGSGIAQVAAAAGRQVIQFDVNPAMLDKSKEAIEQNMQVLVNKGKISLEESLAAQQRIRFTSDISECVADLIIEAIVEQPEAKRNLFQQLLLINHKDAIFASNTSSISINSIAAGFPASHQLVGMHFFNPAPVMKLVEIVKGEQTAGEVIKTITSLAIEMGKIPVICKDSPGFIVNRVARPYYLEAMRLLEENLATIETVDKVMEAAGFKMGPFKLMDLIGLDINYNVSQIVWEALGRPERLKPSDVQKEKVAEQTLGKKTGKGFYQYER